METLQGIDPECNDVPWVNVFIIFLTLCVGLTAILERIQNT